MSAQTLDLGRVTGRGITGVTHNNDGTLTITFDDNTSYTTGVINGADGVGISSVVLNADYTLTINFTNSTSYTTSVPIRGPKGDTGATGTTGATPQISIGTVTDVPHGTGSSVTVTGTAEAPVLNFELQSGVSGNETIDDTAGIGDDDLVLSADKLTKDFMKVDGQKANSENLYLYKEASGSIVTVDDAVAEIVKQMRIEVAPVQDLHGYANPWPGGGGKNKLPFPYYGTTETINGITFTVNDDGTIKINGTSTARAIFYIVSNSVKVAPQSGSYIFSKESTSDFSVTIDAYNGSTWVKNLGISGITASFDFTLDYDGYDRIECFISIASGITINNVTISPMIRLSSATDDTFAPYSNICPISGWTGCDIIQVTKNLFNPNPSLLLGFSNTAGTAGTFTTGLYNACVIPIRATSYKLSGFDFSKVSDSVLRVLVSKQYPRVGASEFRLTNVSQNTVISNISDYNYLTIIWEWTSSATEADKNACQIEEGSTATDLSAVAKDYPITFPSEAGTVYGGTLTLNQDGTGTLVVDSIFIEENDSSKFGRNNAKQYYYNKASDVIKKGVGAYAVISNKFRGDGINTGNDGICFVNNSGAIRFNTINEYDSTSEMIADIGTLQFICPLATPVTYTLTAPQVKTLLGLNNVWSDTGSILSFLYATDNNAKKDGTHEDLTAGNALYLLSDRGDTDVEPYVFRKTGGAKNGYGRECLRKIVGGTVAWNQMAKEINSTNWKAEPNVTITFADGVCSFTSGTVNNGINSNVSVDFLPSHRYLVSLIAKAASNCDIAVLIGSTNGATKNFAVTTTYAQYCRILTTGANVTGKKMYVIAPNGSTGIQIDVQKCMVFDLTQMFGSTIADAIYAMEQATAGSGVAWFRNLFPNSYYAYDAGSLQSVQAKEHRLTGFNQWDEQWEVGAYNGLTGEKMNGTSSIRNKNKIRVYQNNTYYLKTPSYASPFGLYLWAYDKDENYIGRLDAGGMGGTQGVFGNITIPNGVFYINFICYISPVTYLHDICINFSDSSLNGQYKPYEPEHTYPLDSSLTLRGIPKWDSTNGLYYDGDEYTPDGSVKRKYGIVDLGTLNWNKGTTSFITGTIANYIKWPINNSTVVGMIISDGKGKFVSSNDDSGVAGSYEIAENLTGSLTFRYPLDGVSETDFKTAMSGVYLVYELATPTNEQAEGYRELQISAHGGTEEFVDAGVTASTPTRDVSVPVGTESFYPIDVVKYIEELTNPDHDMIADALIPSGKYFMVGNSLYLSTSQIQAGGTINPGTNCTVKTLAEALNEINA